MSPVIIIGAGGHGRVVAEAALGCGCWKKVVFLDDRFPDLRKIDGFDVVNDAGGLVALKDSFADVVVAMGDNRRRIELIDEVLHHGFRCPTIVHSSAVVSRTSSLGDGTVVLANAVIGAGAILGRGCIANHGCTIDHDCVFGDGVHVSPGGHLAGGARVGDYGWIGTGATVNPLVEIGAAAIIGASAGVIADVAPGETVVGVPARPLD